MEQFVKKFWKEENGNTTIDWMVLTAGLLLLGVAVVTSFGSGSMSVADQAPATILETAEFSNV
ncbi:MAG: hypothetical protein KJP02_11615 [Octadecabacter sp.]|nr:hypothetical protein [Octadecabacter sp.]